MNRFSWLLRREWMQHHRGWLILAIAPAIIALVLVPFGQVQLDNAISASTLAPMAALIYLMLMLALAVTSLSFQAPGLARRDQQDRSIEFWLSLPTSHLQSVSATVLLNLVLMPLLVLAVSVVAAQGVAALMVVKVLGAGALGEIAPLPWIGFMLVALLREVVGLLMCLLWLSPLLMLAMVASSWLKGWGVPALVAGLAALGLVLQQLTGRMLIWTLLAQWWEQAKLALLPLTRGTLNLNALDPADNALPWLTHWLLNDTVLLLRAALSPAFAAAVLVAAGAFAVLVWRRPRTV